VLFLEFSYLRPSRPAKHPATPAAAFRRRRPAVCTPWRLGLTRTRTAAIRSASRTRVRNTHIGCIRCAYRLQFPADFAQIAGSAAIVFVHASCLVWSH